ncbi:DUF2306 domain-containing protein [Solirubrum puertoriconensis]|uniref:DUF2306 domain-containing protein n=1 Tax=Solirubrum puertoriconensis TaxID=1751427 RepID=A0A9X0HMY8_SOLP1|nr:DUF2306 domain-containing protein [Solirubrum puertoriconensis]KUG08976.1 hypothetical protein ASU33_11355 [Solirubrum puertoriconensis]
MPRFSPVLRTLQVLIGLAVLLFAGRMLVLIVPYLSFEPGIEFLTTKTAATNSNLLFRVGFYVHITSSLVALLVGLPQFFPQLMRHRRVLHRQLGKVYVATILALAAPSGLVLALYANGGLVAKVGFTMQCLVWWLATWQAYQLARGRQWQAHTEWMVRGFAITLAAMSLRLESYFMYYFLGTKPMETYLTVTWLSWTGNLLLAEVLLQVGLAKRLLRDFAAPKPSLKAQPAVPA